MSPWPLCLCVWPTSHASLDALLLDLLAAGFLPSCFVALTCVLDRIFQFGNCSASDANDVVDLPRPVSQELALASVLSLVAATDVSGPFDPQVYATDASLSKGGHLELRWQHLFGLVVTGKVPLPSLTTLPEPDSGLLDFTLRKTANLDFFLACRVPLTSVLTLLRSAVVQGLVEGFVGLRLFCLCAD